MKAFALFILCLLPTLVSAGISDCAAGYRFDRMSGVGCVQDKCRDVSHAFYNYVGYCVCYACGEVGCSGDKDFSKECRRAPDDKSCPSCLYQCINPKDKCPGEKDPQTAVTPATQPSAQTTQQASQNAPPTTVRNDTLKVKVKGKLTAFGQPLKHIRMYCGDGKVEVTTDENGNYEFETDEVEKGSEYTCEVRFEYVRNDRTYFQIHSGMDDEPVAVPLTFTVDGESTVQDLKVDGLMKDLAGGSESYVAMYVHMTEALEFYIDGLKEDLDFQLPLHVRAYMPDDPTGYKAAYNGEGGVSTIYIQSQYSSQSSDGRPVNREYHEFSHYVMHALYGRWPDTKGEAPIGSTNHGGYLNPSSSDSYVEAFANFMSAAIYKYYGETIPSGKDYSNMRFMELIIAMQNAPVTEWETDYNARDKGGKMEEFAGAGILWDLVDNDGDYRARTPEEAYQKFLEWKKETEEYNRQLAIDEPGEDPIPIPDVNIDFFKNQNLDDDKIDVDFEDLWSVLRTYKGDFTDVYNGLIGKFPDKRGAIDEIFIKHGFFHDPNPGNGQHDDFEPYADVNKNGRFDSGEYFVDMSGVNVSYQRGQRIGAPSDYQRGWRKTTQEVPGQYVVVGNKVPYYRVTVMFPGKPHLNYMYRTGNVNGRIYIKVPPAGYDASVVVAAEGANTGAPLVFSSEAFNKEYPEVAKRGYYKSHDFKVSGPIPAEPTKPNWVNPTKKQAISPWLLLLAGGTAVTIAIAAVAALAFLLLVVSVVVFWKRRHRKKH